MTQDQISVSMVRFQRQFIIIYFALLLTQVLTYVVFGLVLKAETPMMDEETFRIFRLVVPILNFAAVGTGAVLFRFKVKQALATGDADAKFLQYQTGYIIRLGLLESMAILDAIGYYLTGDYFFQMLFALVFALYLLTGYPSEGKIRRELNLGMFE